MLESETRARVIEWILFYREVFGCERDFSDLLIPLPQPDFDRLIIVAAGAVPSKIVSAINQRMRIWCFTDELDNVVTSVRKAGHDYAVWTRDRVEAEECDEGVLIEDVVKDGAAFMTLEERLLYGFKYYLETGRHLDSKGITFCGGSTTNGEGGGYPPRVSWSFVRLSIARHYPGSLYGRHAGVRAVRGI